MVNELVDRQESSSNLNLDLVSFDLDHDTLRAELIDALGFSHEHDLELLTIWVVVNVLCQLFVSSVSLGRNVDSDPRLEIDDVSLEGVYLFLALLESFEQLQGLLLSLVALLLDCLDKVSGRQDLPLKVLFVLEGFVIL